MGHSLLNGHQHFLAPARRHRRERQTRPVLTRQPEGAKRFPHFGRPEQRVDRGHHRLRRTEVHWQRVVPAHGGVAGIEIAVDIRASKGVDGLLRVPDEQQCTFGAVFFQPINLVEDG